MRVDPNSQTASYLQIRSQTASVRRAPSNGDRAEFSGADSINSALGNAAEVRSEKLERAKALVADKNYPARPVLQQVAKVIARSVDLDPQM